MAEEVHKRLKVDYILCSLIDYIKVNKTEFEGCSALLTSKGQEEQEGLERRQRELRR